MTKVMIVSACSPHTADVSWSAYWLRADAQDFGT